MNSEVQSRLLRCFSAVFPALKMEDMPGATPASVRAWDSIATVTLFAVIEEEFGAGTLTTVELPELSFTSILRHLEYLKECAHPDSSGALGHAGPRV
jgi:hypothetical protein